MTSKNISHLTSVGLVFCCWALIYAGASLSARCKLKRHTHKAMQTDFNGRRCWDDVKIVSCWGYCLSYEISDWQFPYKESHHPVCVHGERRHASVKLRHCDPNVQPGTEVYHYVEAVSCKCQLHLLESGNVLDSGNIGKKVCSSEDTSCEWLPPDSSVLGGLILKEELEEEIDQTI